LTQFGHLLPAPTASPVDARYTDSIIRDAIISFQELAGLPLTGRPIQQIYLTN